MDSKELSYRIKDAEEPTSEGSPWKGLCPTGKHEHPTVGEFDWRDGNIKILLKCWKGCPDEKILEALGLSNDELYFDHLSLAALAGEKKLSVDYLTTELGVTQVGKLVRIEYRNMDGCVGERHQLRHKGRPKFTWTKGTGKTCPYGLWRLDEARAQGRLFIVEGPSDCWAGWFHGLPMLGLPGA